MMIKITQLEKYKKLVIRIKKVKKKSKIKFLYGLVQDIMCQNKPTQTGTSQYGPIQLIESSTKSEMFQD